MTMEQRDDVDLQVPAGDDLHRHFRKQVGRLLWLAQVRPDLQHAVMCLSRKVGGPSVWDMRALRRCVRYLSGTSARGLMIQPTSHWALNGFADADWAGDVQDRTYCSGGVLQLAGVTISAWPRVQQAVSLSSCESEFYSMSCCASELLYVSSLLNDIGLSVDVPTLWGDSSSAIALVGRKGPGRLRHMEIRWLALQSWQQAGRVRVRKISGQTNPADYLTKFATSAAHQTGIELSRMS